MKKIYYAFFCALLLVSNVNAQESSNLIKINLLPLSVGNVSLEYERLITSKISVDVALSWKAKTNLPFKSTIESLVDDDSGILASTKLGAFSITPEVRFYMGKKDAFKGFYIAPFIKYSNYNIATVVTFESNGMSADLPVDGKLTAYTGGVAVGNQWSLGKNIFLDWRIIGPSYGFSSGNLEGKRQLNSMEQDEIRNQLEDLDLVIFNTKTEVNANGATVKTDGGFAGIRTALSIGYRF